MTLKPLEGVIEDDQRLPFSSPKISFRGLPCACVDLSCGCCAGLNISAIKFDRRYCANFTFDPSNFEVDMKVMMNDNEIYKTSVSGNFMEKTKFFFLFTENFFIKLFLVK